MLQDALDGKCTAQQICELPPDQRLDVLRVRHRLMQPADLSLVVNSLPVMYGPELLMDMPEVAVEHYEKIPVYTLQLLALDYPALAHKVKYKLWQDTIDELIKRFPGHAIKLSNVLSDEHIDALITVLPGTVAREIPHLLSHEHLERYVKSQDLKVFAKHVLKKHLSYDQVMELRG